MKVSTLSYQGLSSIKAVLDYRPTKEGRYTVLLQVIHNRHRCVVFTPYHLFKEEFDRDRGVVVALDKSPSSRAFAREANEYIASHTEELLGVVAELVSSGTPIVPTDITARYRRRNDLRLVHTYTLSLADDLDRDGSHGTARTYRAALSAFEKYTGHTNCRFDDLDSVLINGFDRHLRRTSLQRNTITFYMRVLRAVHNKARHAHLTCGLDDPFESISFRIDKTRKLAIGADVLRATADADFGDRKCLDEARDLFMFSFYARGMSFVDMAFLRRDDIRDGVIRYTRKKTGQLFSVRITKPLRVLIDKYARCDPWVLPVMHASSLSWDMRPDIAFIGAKECDSAEHRQLLHRRYKLAFNRYWVHLLEISNLLHLDQKLTFNVARHSWASLARNRGVPVAVISEGLGHTSEKTTNIYLDQLDSREVDKSNDIVTKL